MKMTSSTSMTSTRGVTLISDMAPASSSSLKAITDSREVSLRQVHELQREVAHVQSRHTYLAIEIVIGDERGDRRHEAGGRVDERLPDARRHGHDGRGALRADAPDRHHDSPHLS